MITADDAYFERYREAYHKVMEKFVPAGKEPEEKERLRYLVKMMGLHELTLMNEDIMERIANPGTKNCITEWMEECMQEKDWAGLCRLMNQRFKEETLPSIYGGYAYEKHLLSAFEAFACGNLQAVECLLPMKLAEVTNGNEPCFLAGTHLLLGLMSGEEELLARAVPEAEAFLQQKRVNKFEKAMVAFLLSLYAKDMEKASEDLLAVCKGYAGDKKCVLGVRPFCTFAHGLYVFAETILPEEQFALLELPRHKSFLAEFAVWRREHKNPDLAPFILYPEDITWVNEIYEAAPAHLVLWQPNLDSPNVRQAERENWSAHGVRWVNQFADEIWERTRNE